MKKYDVVVIGAGNGGISAAVALAQKGLKPLVIEQHNLPGGCASSFVRGRFEYDVSLHSMYYESNFKPVFEGMMGLTAQFPEVAQEFENIYVEDGKIIREHYDLTGDMEKQIEEKHPGCGAQWYTLVNLMREMQPAFGAFTAPGADMGKVMMEYPSFAKYGLMPVEQVFEEFKTPQYLRNLLSLFWWYAGMSPEIAPFAMYSMIAGSEFSIPINYPKETAHGYLAEMESIIRKHGGDIWFNTTVTAINTENGFVTSVETSQGDIIPTNFVISDIDSRAIFGGMLKGADEVCAQIGQQLSVVKENFSFIVIYLGMDASADELGIKDHHIYINEDFNANTVYNHCGSWDGPKTIGVMCPNVTIPDFSPEGTCVLSISVPVQGSILEGLDQKGYIEKKHEFEAKIISKVEKYLGVDIKSHIEEIETATPATISRYAKLYNGSLGNLMSVQQMPVTGAINGQINSGIIKELAFIGQYAMALGYQNTVNGYMAATGMVDMMKEVK